jgi:hypothetical protein
MRARSPAGAPAIFGPLQIPVAVPSRKVHLSSSFSSIIWWWLTIFNDSHERRFNINIH